MIGFAARGFWSAALVFLGLGAPLQLCTAGQAGGCGCQLDRSSLQPPGEEPDVVPSSGAQESPEAGEGAALGAQELCLFRAPCVCPPLVLPSFPVEFEYAATQHNNTNINMLKAKQINIFYVWALEIRFYITIDVISMLLCYLCSAIPLVDE